MFTWINGEFIDEAGAKVSANDRGFLYGDGLFETFRVYRRRFFRFDWHWMRLRAGAQALRLNLPEDQAATARRGIELLEKNGLADAVVRLQLTRGPGPRGYSPRGADHPTWSLSCHPLPEAAPEAGWRLSVASQRIPSFAPFSRYKTCNRLPQILARMEAEDQGASDAILLNEKDQVAETASANLFWLDQGVLYTPPPDTGLLPGVTRAVVMELCDRLEIECVEKAAKIPELLAAEAVFLTQSVLEIIPVITIGHSSIPTHSLANRIRQEYHALAVQETS
jgi:branched-chain amino acid aminotransferase